MSISLRHILFICFLLGGRLQAFTQPGRPAAAQENHRDRLYLLSHEFVYLVTADVYGKNVSVALVKDGQTHFTAWVPDSNINTIYATALQTDPDGHWITSRYAVEPWRNAADQQLLKTIFSNELGLPENAIQVGGMTKKILVRKTGKCTEVKPLAENAGIAWLQSPDAAPASQPAGQPITLPPHSAVYLYGFLPRDLGDTGVAPAMIPLKVLGQTPEGISLDSKPPLPEGAPVFNDKGALLGIYSGAQRTGADAHTVFFPLTNVNVQP
jgi:hypothetical protein